MAAESGGNHKVSRGTGIPACATLFYAASMRKIVLAVAGLLTLGAADEVPESIKQRNEVYGGELEKYFQDYLVTQYPGRAQEAWRRSYQTQQAFLKSVEPNRRRYRRIFSPPDLKPTGALERKPHPIPGVKAEWLTLPLGL